MKWSLHNARVVFNAFPGNDTINRAHGHRVLLNSKFVEPLISHFADTDTLLTCQWKPQPPAWHW
jgi:hypothetical protein